MSDPPYDVEKDPYPLMSQWRQSERHHMIQAMRDMIDEATRMAKSKRAPASERIRWTRLAGQLIWYKDSILRSMSLESMENEMALLKKQVLTKKPEQEPRPGYMYRTITEPAKGSTT
jgi:thiamine kinase-like enzyme